MDKLAGWIFGLSGAVLLVDVAFFGPGIKFPGVPFSIRRSLFLMMIVAALALRLMLRRSFTRAEAGLLVAVLTLILGWAVILPMANGYEVGHAVADVSPWIALLFVAIWPWPQWYAHLDWRRVRKIVIALGVILACAHVILWALLVTEIISPEVFYLGAEVLFGTDAEGDAFMRIAEVPTGYRVYWSSSIFLLGCIYFLLAYAPKTGRLRWWMTILLIGFALWTTQIRAFLGSMLIFAVAWPVLRAVGPRVARIVPTRIQVLVLWAASIMMVSIVINPAVLETIGMSREQGSDSERLEQAAPLMSQFLTRPILGNGFGSYTPRVLRSDDAPFSYELTFYALLMKLGVVGSMVLATIFALALSCVRVEHAAVRNPKAFALWAAFTTGLWFSAATNPMVTSFVGMAMIVLIFIDLRQQAYGNTAAAGAKAVPFKDTDLRAPA